MSTEGAPAPQNTRAEKKESNRAGYIEAALAGFAMLAAAHENVQALEMPTYEPWHIGIQDRVRDAVKKDKVEHGIVYAQFTDHSGAWLNLKKGELSGVDFDKDQAGKEILSERGNREINATCHIHTHQANILAEKYAASPREALKVSNPPSDTDVAFARKVSHYYKIKKIPVGKLSFAVADGRGMWYFSASAKAPVDIAAAGELRTQRTASENKWYSVFETFRINSAEPSFDFKKEFPKLRAAYQTHLGGDIRFVDYKNMDNEPPCAGVDYKPEPKTSQAR